MPTYTFYCEPCGEGEVLLVPYTERDSQVCPRCSGTYGRKPEMPHPTKASYVDGQRGRTGDWKDMREASKLTKEAAGLAGGSEARKEIEKEIRKGLKVDITK